MHLHRCLCADSSAHAPISIWKSFDQEIWIESFVFPIGTGPAQWVATRIAHHADIPLAVTDSVIGAGVCMAMDPQSGLTHEVGVNVCAKRGSHRVVGVFW